MWSLTGSFESTGHVAWSFAENRWDEEAGLRISISLPGDMALTKTQTVDALKMLLRQGGDVPWMAPRHPSWRVDLDGVGKLLRQMDSRLENPRWLAGTVAIEPEFQVGQRTHCVEEFTPGAERVPNARLRPEPRFDNSAVFYVRPQEVLAQMTPSWTYDLFICHASEDKETLVDDLVAELRSVGLKVWYDRFEMTIGDRLRQSIDEGLRDSEFGVVVLSHNFFKKQWPQGELEGMAARERGGRKVILPVWHEIDVAEVLSYSPLLAGRIGAQSCNGVPQVVIALQKAMTKERSRTNLEGPRDPPPPDLSRAKDSGRKPAVTDCARLARERFAARIAGRLNDIRRQFATIQIEAGRLGMGLSSTVTSKASTVAHNEMKELCQLAWADLRFVIEQLEVSGDGIVAEDLKRHMQEIVSTATPDLVRLYRGFVESMPGDKPNLEADVLPSLRPVFAEIDIYAAAAKGKRR